MFAQGKGGEKSISIALGRGPTSGGKYLPFPDLFFSVMATEP